MKKTKKQKEEARWMDFLCQLVNQLCIISCIIPQNGWKDADEGDVKVLGSAKKVLGRIISMDTFKLLRSIVNYQCIRREFFYNGKFLVRVDLLPTRSIIHLSGKQLKHSNKSKKNLPKLTVEEYAYLDGFHWKEAMIGIKEYSERKYDWKHYSHCSKKNRPSNKRRGDYRIFR